MGLLAGRNKRDTERFRKALRTLGRRIAELRKEKRWSQARLAEKSGLGNNTIGQIERAELCCTLETLFPIASALGTTAAELIKDLDPLVQGPSTYSDDH